MPNIAQIAAKILLVTQAAWMLAPVHAQEAPAKPRTHSVFKHRVHHRPHRHMGALHGLQHRMDAPTARETDVGYGGFFKAQHHEEARAFYSEPEHQGYCAVAMKTLRSDCVAAGQAKPWQLGQPLPASVAVYRLPRPLEIQLGPPPTGYRYRRVGADIVLLQPHTAKVVDAIEDAVH